MIGVADPRSPGDRRGQAQDADGAERADGERADGERAHEGGEDRDALERLAELRELSRSTAHEFGNLLSVVRVNAELLAEGASERDRVLLEELRAAAERGTALVQTLQSRARAAPLEVAPIEPGPVEPALVPPDGESAAAAVPVPRRVLVVDDDELVRRMIQRVLEIDGHTVTVASSGDEALRALAAGAATDILVTDVQMPGMSGPQLVARARVRAPDIRVLYVSALPDRDSAPRDGDGVLGKPFAPQALRQAVATLAAASAATQGGASP